MTLFTADWLTTEPADYQLKKYTLLAKIQNLEKRITNNELYSALIIIEEQLKYVYRFVNNHQQIIDNQKKVTGIDIYTMDLTYTYPKQEHNLLKLAHLAVEELEHLHKKVRHQWRIYVNSVKITEVPEKRVTKTQGIVFLILNNNLITYSYQVPEKIQQTNYKDFILQRIYKVNDYDKKIIDYIIEFEKGSNKNRFWRCDLKDNLATMPLDELILPLLKFNLFYKLKDN